MKKIIVFIGLFLMGLTVVNAQSQKSDTKSVQSKSENLNSKSEAYHAKREKKFIEFNSVVNLSKEQQEKVKAISDATNLKLKAVVDKYPEKSEERKTEINSIEKERNKQVFSVLTAEQQAKWKAYKESKKENDHTNHNHSAPSDK